MRSRARRALLGLTALVLLALGCEVHRPACRYLVPKGDVGWVVIELNASGARPPAERDGFRVFETPASGRLAIPGAPEEGWAADEYFYATGARQALPVTAPGGAG